MGDKLQLTVFVWNKGKIRLGAQIRPAPLPQHTHTHKHTAESIEEIWKGSVNFIGTVMGYVEEARENHVKKKVEEGKIIYLLIICIIKIHLKPYFTFYYVQITRR